QPAVPTQPAEREKRVRAARGSLTVENGDYKGKELSFDSRTTCLAGRAEACRLRLPRDPLTKIVSRYHCLLDGRPPCGLVEDLGGSDGTDVNGRSIGCRRGGQAAEDGSSGTYMGCRLADGDEISLGHISLRVHVINPPEEDDKVTR